jgi:DNA-binding XRE family transcriptional regulator
MAGAAPFDACPVSAFDQFSSAVRERFGAREGWQIIVEPPLRPEGAHNLTLVRDDGYLIEIEWQRNRGFGIAAGKDMVFGSGVDEIYGAPATALERIKWLVESGEATSSDAALELTELRKLRGLLQKDVAERLGITKSGLAQMERPASLTSMQIDTLQRLVAGMGGELVLTARFPDGAERQIAVD